MKTSQELIEIEHMNFPLFIHKQNRVSMAFLCGIAFAISYMLPNQFHIFVPQLLPLTDYDKAIPLMPWTIFIYLSEYFLFVGAYFAFTDELNRNRYVWAYFGILLVGMFIFFFFPTTYPRHLYPLPGDIHPLIFYAFSFLRAVDDPSNCFPSMHVSCCFMTAFAFLPKSEPRYKFWLFFVWAFLVALSTLPTKQHYITDVISGFVLAWAGYWIFFKLVKYEPLPDFLMRLKAKATTKFL